MIDKTVGIAASAVGILVAVAAVVTAYDHLNSRLDKVDDKIGAIQKSLGSTTCNAILSRQMEAIDKNKTLARKALDGLSKQYGCGPQSDVVIVPDFGQENAAMTTTAKSYDTRQLRQQLNAVDMQLNKKD